MKKVKIKVKRQKNIFKKILDLFLVSVFAILTLFLIINIISLSDIENLIRIIVIIILILVFCILFLFYRMRRVICRIILLILSLIYIFLNFTFYKVYSSLDSITKQVDTKGICLVTNKDNMDTIDDITNDDIAILAFDMDETFYEMAENIVKDEKLKNKLVEYDGYFEIINALLKKEINYAFLPENYNDIYKASNGEESKELKFKVLYTEQKVIENTDASIQNKTLDEPFSILLMGTDVILDSYNADTLMVVTVNPKTMKVTMLSIPRDTYTTIACTGGKHKINASGWYGDGCVVKTVAKYLDIDIDYYAKINFLGIVDLVDNLGGIEVDVPYALCEQNSKRQFGKNMIYVEEGLQTLNGEQALALSRNRHYWKDLCPSKYTSGGTRSDLMRGQNQQLVIKAILSKLMSVRDLNQFYAILDTVGNNMTTNMSKDTILSFYNVGKDIVKRFNVSDADDIINVEKLSLKSSFATVHVSGLDLSMIVNYKESVEYVSKQMKKNLGLVKIETIKTISFDVNNKYDPHEVKYNKLSYDLSLLPSFVGKTLGEAFNYCKTNNLKCECDVDDNDAIIKNQSIAAKTDITTIRNKTITFTVEQFKNNVPSNEDNKDNSELIVPDDTNNDESNNSNKDSGNNDSENIPLNPDNSSNNNNESNQDDSSDNNGNSTLETPNDNENVSEEEKGDSSEKES